MTSAFSNSLTASQFQPLDLSRQGLQASRPNPFDAMPENLGRRPRSDFGLEGFLVVQSLPRIVVQIVQRVGPVVESSAFGDFSIKVFISEKNVPLKAAPLKYASVSRTPSPC